MSLYVGTASPGPGCDPSGPPPSPGRLGDSRPSSERSATQASMSTSICSEKSGIVAFDSAIRRAIVAWVRVSSTTVVSPFAVATPSSTAACAARCRRRGAGARRRSGAGGGRAAAGAGSAAPRCPARRPSRSFRRGPSRTRVSRSIPLSLRQPAGQRRGPDPAVLGACAGSREAAGCEADATAGISGAGAGAGGVAGCSAVWRPAPSRAAGSASTERWPVGGGSAAASVLPGPTRAISSPMASVAPSGATISSTPSWSDS